ncbi:DUF4395 domain-containing protein [Planosporangium thailandense]|uniref:DUF4395 domain-containing protein n=1 Tax=Planosporangium thailandense TaxID=765197 RepID=A0ABX0XWP4_9ACTN|nr:DUF4395 domain-containing protein [Planosporangium thailandense]NJC69684.1 DUF4395 domain-containing protein [Planosporangium thailandense]
MLDPRGSRFVAAVTSVVLALVIVLSSGWLALAQTVVFGIGAASVWYAPYGWLYRKIVARRIGPPPPMREPSQPVRFAQGLGFVLMAVATFGYLVGVPTVGMVATTVAFAAAFAKAVTGLSLGCEVYLLLRRLHVRV